MNVNRNGMTYELCWKHHSILTNDHNVIWITFLISKDCSLLCRRLAVHMMDATCLTYVIWHYHLMCGRLHVIWWTSHMISLGIYIYQLQIYTQCIWTLFWDYTDYILHSYVVGFLAMDDAAADAYLMTMRLNKRYLEDVWV